jgi:hypothetical protein
LNKSKSKAEPGRAPATEVLLSYDDIATRWNIHVEVVKRKIRASEIPVVRLNRKLVRVRLSDILAIEEAAISNLPKNFQSRFPKHGEEVSA